MYSLTGLVFSVIELAPRASDILSKGAIELQPQTTLMMDFVCHCAFRFIYFVGMNILPVSMCTTHVLGQQRSEEGSLGYPRTGTAEGVSHPVGAGQMFLIAESSLHPQFDAF